MGEIKDPYIAQALLVRVSDRILPIFCYDVDWYKGDYYGLQIRPRNINRDNIDSNWLVYIGSNGLKTDSVAMTHKRFIFVQKNIIRILGIIGFVKIEEARRKVDIILKLDTMKERRKEVVVEISAQKKLGKKTKGLSKELRSLNRILEPQSVSSSKKGKVQYSCYNPKPYQGGAFTPR